MSAVAITQQTAAEVLANQHQADEGLGENSICVILKHGMIGSSKKVDVSRLEVKKEHSYDKETAKSMLRASKYLFTSDKFNAIDRYDRETVRILEALTVSFAIFKDGCRFSPPARIDEIDSMLHERQLGRGPLVEIFLAEYEHIMKEGMNLLGTLADSGDYYTVDEARKRFRMEWYFLQMKSPTQSETGMSSEAYRRMKERLEAKFAEAEQTIELGMMAAAQEMVDHLLDRLAGGPGGKPQKFHDSLTSKFADFLSTYDDKIKLLKNHSDLDKLGQTMRMLLDGVDPKALRKSEDTRAAIVAGFSDIKKALDTMIVAKGRAVAVDDKGLIN